MFGNDRIGGYEMLSDYDSNNDGVIDANDDIWGTLQLWQDKNQDGISQADELITLDQAGFAALNLSVKEVNEVIAGNDVTAQGEVTMKDGTTIYGYDAWFPCFGYNFGFFFVHFSIQNVVLYVSHFKHSA